MVPPREVRVFAEGSLVGVRASGTGGWSTASGAAVWAIGFVRPGFHFSVGDSYQVVNRLGRPSHYKRVAFNEVMGSFTVYVQHTANWPQLRGASGSGLGVTTPQVHLEFKQESPENAASGIYAIFMNVVMQPAILTEAEEGNTYELPFRALSVVWPTASGYLIA